MWPFKWPWDRSPCHNAPGERIHWGMDWHLIVPNAPELEQIDLRAAREVRLRPGQPIWALLPQGPWRGKHILAPEEIFRAAQALSCHGLAAHQRELQSGFLPLPGGHRLGICGIMDAGGLREITSLCVRQCHEILGAGEDVFPLVRGKNALILGPPGAGKTTLLRDLARLSSQSGVQVGIIDERGEIAACREGRPLMDVGPCCDVVTGMDRFSAALLLIRAMAPQVIITDELGGPRDAQAMKEAVRCGVSVIASAHGRGPGDAADRRGMEKMLPLFDLLVILTAPGRPPQIVQNRKEGAPCNGSWP